MIEENIQVLRQAAKFTSNKDENIWCVIAAPYDFIDDIAYRAISSNGRVEILFREHVILNEGNLNKKFDFIMLKGLSSTIRYYKLLASQNGASFIQVTPSYIKEKPNLMVLVAPDNIIRKSIALLGEFKTDMSILMESQSSRSVEVEVNPSSVIPEIMRTKLNSLVNVSDISILTLLISVEEADVDKVQSVVTSNRIFVIDFKDIEMEENL